MAIIDQIIGAESSGNPNARSKTSSAAGLGQFINSTWLDMMKRYRPDLTEGKSQDQILALRTDPQLSREMTTNYASENAARLRSVGHEPTAGSTYLAHFAGPGTAIKLLNAEPGAPAAPIMGDAAVKSNPFLANMTAGQLRSWADRKMGAPIPPMPIPMPEAPRAPPMAAAPPPAPFSLAPPTQAAAPTVGQPANLMAFMQTQAPPQMPMQQAPAQPMPGLDEARQQSEAAQPMTNQPNSGYPPENLAMARALMAAMQRQATG